MVRADKQQLLFLNYSICDTYSKMSDTETDIKRFYSPMTRTFTIIDREGTYHYGLDTLIPHHVNDLTIINDLNAKTIFAINDTHLILYVYNQLIFFSRATKEVTMQPLSRLLPNPKVVIGRHAVIAYKDNIIYSRDLAYPDDTSEWTYDTEEQRISIAKAQLRHNVIPAMFDILQASPIELKVYLYVLRHKTTGHVYVCYHGISSEKAILNTVYDMMKFRILNHRDGGHYVMDENFMTIHVADRVTIADVRIVTPSEWEAIIAQ